MPAPDVSLYLDGELVAVARVAAGWWSRLRGLLGVRRFEHPAGLLIPRCSSVHSLGMSIAIDVLYLDDEFEVVKAVGRFKPWRMSLGGRRAKQTLELPAGTIERTRIARGRRLEVRRSSSD